MSSIKVTKDNKLAVQRLSEDLRRLVNNVSSALHDFFEDLVDGKLGEALSKMTIYLFNGWCTKYDVPLLRDVSNVVAESIRKVLESAENKRATLREELVSRLSLSLRMNKEDVNNIVAEYVSNAVMSHEIEKAAQVCAKRLLGDYIKLFINQTAHVIVARLLVHRVLECKGYGGELSLQDPLKKLIAIRELYESVLPNIFLLSEFDWWYVPDTLRALDADKLKLLLRHEDLLKRRIQEVLVSLDNYDLSQVDFDVWQEVYQYYLPSEERQRLGGFYTPRELVTLIEDLAGYVVGAEHLCTKQVLDPACGSGTFIVEVATRLVEHLNKDIPCHKQKLPKTEWGRARYIVDTVRNNVYAIDIHPFATFLTSLNLTMFLLDYFMKVYHQDKTYKLEFNVVTSDSLLKSIEAFITDYYENARAKEVAKRLEMYRHLLGMKFDFVFGNPPWGTVLKGDLSPLWNPKKRKEYLKRYKSATGKYDVCVLFLERALEWLKSEGIAAMVVNNWFLIRDFGKGIREIIARSSKILYLIDLGDYGKDLFKAMNNPLVIVLKKSHADVEATVVRVVKEACPSASQAIEAIRAFLGGLTRSYLQVYKLSQEFFRKRIKEGWRLAEESSIKLVDLLTALADKKYACRVSELFADVQGVTTGLNEVYVINDVKLKDLKHNGIDLLSEPLLYKCLAGKEIKAWKIEWQKNYIVLPYTKKDCEWARAFLIRYKNSEVDALDLEKPLEPAEKNMKEKERFNSRVAKGLIKYPITAKYLVEHYDQLRSRIYEGKRVEEYAGAWYAYHRVRDLDLLLARSKIVTPRLCDKVSFALDEEGFLPLDSVVALVPKEGFENLKNELKELLHTNSNEELSRKALLYTLAFLNSSMSNNVLTVGAPRTPKGDYSIDERLLSKLIILRPSKISRDHVAKILALAEKIVANGDQRALEELNNMVDELHATMLKSVSSP